MQALERYLPSPRPRSYTPLAQDSTIRKLQLKFGHFCIKLSFSMCADTDVRSTGECMWRKVLSRGRHLDK